MADGLNSQGGQIEFLHSVSASGRLRVVRRGSGAAGHCYEAEAGTKELAQMSLIIAIRRILEHSFT
jgi:hypothetical protein